MSNEGMACEGSSDVSRKLSMEDVHSNLSSTIQTQGATLDQLRGIRSSLWGAEPEVGNISGPESVPDDGSLNLLHRKSSTIGSNAEQINMLVNELSRQLLG